MQHTPACITCMHSRSTQIIGMVTSIVVLRFPRTPPPLCHLWKVFFSFCSGNGGEIARELFAILPAASSSRRSTKHTSDRQWRRRYSVCCWLLMKPTINTTLSPKAHRCLKQAHRRRIEDTPLPSPPKKTRLNARQLQVYMIYYNPGQRKDPSSRFAARRTLFHVWYHARSGVISPGQVRSATVRDFCPALIAPDRAWYHTWNSVLLAANLEDSSFFLSRVVDSMHDTLSRL